MNKFICTGRLTRDIELKYVGDNSIPNAKFNIAIQRRFKRDNEPDTDFINCVAWGKIAETCEKYVTKGMKIGITGHIQTGNYINKDGQKVYTTDLIVEEIEFLESKNSANKNIDQRQDESWKNIPNDIADEELPFN